VVVVGEGWVPEMLPLVVVAVVVVGMTYWVVVVVMVMVMMICMISQFLGLILDPGQPQGYI